ncbi:MAG: RIP metalloprotease RseP [Actinomycetota bacterium]|nr:RIP metalloprotease RseP [Actinomycetota bacterium]
MTILISLLGLIALVVIHELGHMLTAKALGVRVPEFGIGFGPALLKQKFGKTMYSFRVILLGGFAKMAGMNDDEVGPDTYPEKAAWRRALIIFAGPFANILAAMLILTVIYVSGVPTDAEPEIEAVLPGSLAAEVGLQQGDDIVSIEGEPVQEWKDFQGVVGEKRPGDEVTLVVERNGEREVYSGTLQADPENPERAIVGIRPVIDYTNYEPLEALWLGAKRTVQIIGLFGWFVGQLVTGDISFYDSVSSPIAVVGVSSDVATQGVQSFAQFWAFISINLAVINLLPLLPLDGGHLFVIAAEKVLGRPVSAETVNRIAAFGLALMFMIFLFSTYTDLSKIFTGQPFITDQHP